MSLKPSTLYLSRFGIVLAIAYTIPVIFFLKDRRFSDVWLLYLGSAIFLFLSFVFGIIFGSKNKDNPQKKYNGFTVTIIGVIFSVVLILILTLILAPDVYGIGSANDVLHQTPPAITTSGNHGILFMMLADAIIINFAAGTFSAVIAKSKNEEKKLPSNEFPVDE